MPTASKQAKQEIRERVWRLLEESGVARFPRPVYGRIPNFIGAEEAARRLFELKEWSRAQVVKVNPDAPQHPVRLQALLDGKLLIMASPRLREGFILLDPRGIPTRAYGRAATIRGAFLFGRKLDLDGLKRLGSVDLVVEGSVAVSPDGGRLGKGEGYAELEYAILRELGLVDESTPIATTVHELQLVGRIPRDPWDVPVDIIATPKRVIRVSRRGPRPKGVIWSAVTPEMLSRMPVLRELARLKRGRG